MPHLPQDYIDIKDFDWLGIVEEGIGVGHPRWGDAGGAQIVIQTAAVHDVRPLVEIGPQVHWGQAKLLTFTDL